NWVLESQLPVGLRESPERMDLPSAGGDEHRRRLRRRQRHRLRDLYRRLNDRVVGIFDGPGCPPISGVSFALPWGRGAARRCPSYPRTLYFVRRAGLRALRFRGGSAPVLARAPPPTLRGADELDGRACAQGIGDDSYRRRYVNGSRRPRRRQGAANRLVRRA